MPWLRLCNFALKFCTAHRRWVYSSTFIGRQRVERAKGSSKQPRQEIEGDTEKGLEGVEERRELAYIYFGQQSQVYNDFVFLSEEWRSTGARRAGKQKRRGHADGH